MTTSTTSESLAAGPSLDDALAANRAFYHAFSSRDLATMDTIWARGVPVLCIHPGWPALMERAAVLSSLRCVRMVSVSWLSTGNKGFRLVIGS